MTPEDVALYLVDPVFAVSLGAEPPCCSRCGGTIKKPPASWNGESELSHLIPAVCEWERDGTYRATIGSTEDKT